MSTMLQCKKGRAEARLLPLFQFGDRLKFLEIKFNNKHYSIKLYNTWIWRIQKLEKKINNIAEYYAIPRVDFTANESVYPFLFQWNQPNVCRIFLTFAHA